MQENYLVQLQSITFLGQTEEYWNLDFTDEFIRRKDVYYVFLLYAIYPKHDTEIYFERT